MQDFEKLGVFYLGRELDATHNQPTDNPILYDSKDLTTHAVCVGMTGSGKTGLCLAVLEEAAIDGIPAIAIDPKGDLGNLMLAFPNLAPADFRPWVDSQEAARKGLSVDDYAAQTAATWKKGLADWGQSPERIGRFKDAVDVAIYTPGSNAGISLSVLQSFAAPTGILATDTAALRDRIGAVVSGVLGLLGIDADPLKSREHILLANIFEEAWSAGRSLDMAGIINAIQKPAFDKVGVFDLETFFPAKDRLGLAMAVNNLLASPGFSAWMSGEPLDIQRLLFTPEGKPRLSIISIAHLSDPERMFFVTLLLNEVISWMRNQSGTSSLRALLYMDEIFGYFPPTAMPPSKVPMLTLLKQARAFGVGVVLATQNPVDLDYKGLANAGTWLIGRLQTERDKARVIEGLESALASRADSLDRATLDKLLSGLASRVFLMRNVHEDEPVLLQSRWALSYLRGPLTLPEIQTLMASRKSAPAARAASPAPTAVQAPATAAHPNIPANVTEYFLRATPGTGPLTYRPALVGFAKLHYVDTKTSTDLWQSFG
ncbi:MAG: ATP-binding protein, partial [Steroidobacterales bacterium]